jgi:hypothetical protein
MKIDTKFDINQVVWFIDKSKVHKGSVFSIDILKSNCMQLEIYKINLGSGLITKESSEVFSSKQSLIDSIIE